MERACNRTPRQAVGRRRIVALVVTAIVPIALVVGFGHRGVHAVRNLIVPGSGLFGTAWGLGIGCTVLFIAASVLWVRWGADWTVVAVLAASIAASLIISPGGSTKAAQELVQAKASHEFPLVMLFLAFWQWCRGLPLINRLRHRPKVQLSGLGDLAALSTVDRCRAVSVLSLAGPLPAEAAATIGTPDVERRARRIALLTRGRRGVTALDRDQAALRTARVAAGDRSGIAAILRDGARQVSGTPASEPGWIRLLDGALAAAVLDGAGEASPKAAWIEMTNGELGLRKGHRPQLYWTPLGIAIGRAEDWEHALAGAITRPDRTDEWQSLRACVLGAASRGTRHTDDERLIAAGRLWLAAIDDPEAARIVARPTVQHDPLACAIDRLATARARVATTTSAHASP